MSRKHAIYRLRITVDSQSIEVRPESRSARGTHFAIGSVAGDLGNLPHEERKKEIGRVVSEALAK
jgi:hypothetical protein